MPWVVGIILLGLAIKQPSFWFLSAKWRDDFTNKIVSACAILVAYLITAATVIPAVEDKRIVRKLREAGQFGLLIGYLRSAIWSSTVCFALACRFGLVIPSRLGGLAATRQNLLGIILVFRRPLRGLSLPCGQQVTQTPLAS